MLVNREKYVGSSVYYVGRYPVIVVVISMVVEMMCEVKRVCCNTRNDLFHARSKLSSGIAKYFYDFCNT